MKKLLLALACSCGVLCAGEGYRCGFSPAEMKEWNLTPWGKTMREDGRDFLRISVPETQKEGRRSATLPFNIEAYRGRHITVSCLVRAEGVSQPPVYYNGVKVMLSFKAASGMNYRNVIRLWGSFDWKEVHFGFFVPHTAEQGTLYLGLQDSWGSVDFTGLNIAESGRTIFPPVVELPDRFRAEYTPRVTSLSRLRGMMSPIVYRKGDLDDLAAWGANLVRWQLIRNWGEVGTERDLAEYGRWIDGKLDEFEQVLADCERLGIKVVLDLHSPPGGLYETRDMAMFHEKEYAEAFLDTWRKIARRFKGRTSVLFGYNLVNEPRQQSKAGFDYLKLQYMAAQAVREIDPDIPVIIESNMSASPETFEYLTPLPLKDVIYQVHMYYPGRYTHQNVGERSGPVFSYPGEVDGVRCDREELRKHLEPVCRFQQKYGVRIYVGEFSAARWAPGADRYLADCISIFEEYGWDWSYHAFRESKTWDVEYEGSGYRDYVKAAAPTGRLRVLQQGFRKNQ